MRKLVDAPRKKKQWTEKEEAYLQDKWGTVSIKGLSKALGRSENAIIVRAQRLGCGAHLAGDTRISLNQLMLAIYGKNMLGYTSDRLIRYGLPVKWHVVKRSRFRVIDIDAFWKWAEDNKSILDFSRFEKYGLGAEPDWVDVKRKADYKKLQLHGQHKTSTDELCIINSVNAAIALGEATARAVQRIPDAHCNGDMHAALDYAQKVKHEQKNFLNEQALKHIIEEGEQTS